VREQPVRTRVGKDREEVERPEIVVNARSVKAAVQNVAAVIGRA